MPNWNGIAMEEQPGMMQPGRLQLANPLITGPAYDHCPPYGHPRKLIIWAPIMPIIWTDGSGGGAAGMPQGVTDGSNAAPGQVGELLVAENMDGKPCPVKAANTTIWAPDSPWVVAAQLTLTPGDWDVSAMAAFDPPSDPAVGLMYGHATTQLDPNGQPSGWPIGWIYAPLEGFRAISFSIPVERRNVTVTTTLYLMGILEAASDVADVGKEGMVYGYLYARRMR